MVNDEIQYTDKLDILTNTLGTNSFIVMSPDCIVLLSLLCMTRTQQNKCNFVQQYCTGNRDAVARDSSYMGV